MDLYGYFLNDNDIKKVSLGSIRYLTIQLKKFIEIYEKCVLMNDKQKEEFARLKKISELLSSESYSCLISNPNLVIDYDDDNPDYIPDYYPL